MRASLAIAAVVLTVAGLRAETIVVTPGDTLSLIARRTLGSSDRWPELCELNKATLRNCDLLPLGAILVIPEREVTVVEEPAVTPKAGSQSVVSPPTEPELAATQTDLAVPALDVSDTGKTGGVRVNLLADSDSLNGPYWRPYFLRPSISSGHPDPHGGTGAIRLDTADAEDSPHASYSGVYALQKTFPGTYTVGVWLRAVTGTLKIRVGIADKYLAPEEVEVGQDWQYVQAIITVDAETDRRFQVFEHVVGNPSWEIFGASVELGSFDTPF